MLERFRTPIALAVLVFISAGTALAENVDVKANGRMQAIYTFWRTYPGTCNSTPPPTFKIVNNPQHGKLAADVLKTKLPADAKRCAGKQAQFFVVGYQPKRGYRGKDTARVTIRYNKYSNVNVMIKRTLRFNISVK